MGDKMGDKSRSTVLIADDYESYSSDEEYEQTELKVRRREISISDSSDTDATVSAIGDDGTIEEGISVDSDDEELIGEAGFIETADGEASQAKSRQPKGQELLLRSKHSSDEEYEQTELKVRGREISISDSSDTDATVSAIGDDGTIEDGISVDSDDEELIGEAGFIETAEGEASQAKSQQTKRLELLRLKHSQGAGDLNSSAASASLNAAISCRRVMYATCDAITEGKVRVLKALQNAERAEKLDDLNHYRSLASKYDAALKLAAGRARLINAVTECAETAAMSDEVQMFQKINKVATAAQIAKMSTEFLAERFAAAHCAAVANMAAIVAFKAEYVSLKVMKACWEDLDFGNVETRDYPTRSPEETRCSGKKGNVIAWCGIAAFISCICLLAAVSPYTKNSEHLISIVTVGGILISIAVCVLICLIFVCCRNKVKQAIAGLIFCIGLLVVVSPYTKHPEYRISIASIVGIAISIPVCVLICQIFQCSRKTEVKRVKNGNIITKIDNRIRELHNYFVNNNITPFPSIKKQ